MMLKIRDKPGYITVAEMREHYERGISNTPVLKACTPLGTVEINGEFSHYFTPDTDTMWIGFAYGMRMAERVAAQRSDLAAQEEE